ncbi:MAG: septum formation protein Maf [Verrucomicrobiaceae bacterium]|nr:septum formation protein Maf [Verrucomicrobiaceae bacterium]
MNYLSNRNKIILASASPRRKQLLQEANIEFDVIPSNAEEISNLPPLQLVSENARIKAESVAKQNENRLVLGSDTIVALDNIVYGKPRDLIEATQMLTQLQGKTHSVFTAVCLAKSVDGKMKSVCDVQKSDVKFKTLSAEEIQQYLKCVNVLDKAGAYAAQECGEMIIEKIDGDFDNVMGLPMRLVKNMLDTTNF